MSTAKSVVQGRFGRVALLDIDRPVITHAHPHCHLLAKVAGADSSFSISGRELPLLDNTVVLVNAWEPHAYPHAPEAPDSLVLAFYLEPDWLAEIDSTFSVSRSPELFPQSCVERTPQLQQQIDDVVQVLVSDTEHPGIVEDLIKQVMVHVLDEFSQWRSLRGARSIHNRPIVDFRIRRAIQFMRKNIGTHFDIDRVAREAGLSRPHLFTLFKQHTNLTPHLYYNSLRMEDAYERLPDQEMKLGQISASLGFSAQSNFTRFFRENLGISPAEYRRKMRIF